MNSDSLNMVSRLGEGHMPCTFFSLWTTAQDHCGKPNQTKQPKAFVKKSSLTKILIDWGGPFHNINHKNNAAIAIPWFSTLCG